MTDPAKPYFNRIAVEVAKHLDIDPKDMVPMLKVTIGSKVTQGSTLASKKNTWLSLSKTEIKSPVAGLVASIDDTAGIVLIDPDEQPDQTDTSQSEEQTLSIDSSVTLVSQSAPTAIVKIPQPPPAQTYVRPSQQPQNHCSGSIGIGIGSGEGVILESPLSTEMLSASLKSKVLLLAEVPQVAFIFKASAIGIESVIVASADIPKAQEAVRAIEGKAQIGFLLVEPNYDLKPLVGKTITLTGKLSASW